MAGTGKSNNGVWKSCFRGVMLLVVGPAVFLVALMAQAGMLRHSRTFQSPWAVVLRNVNPEVQLQYQFSQQASKENEALLHIMADNTFSSTCLSRSQHMLHRPASHTIPSSPALIEALRAYEKQHAECSRLVGNWTEKFIRDSEIPLSEFSPDGCRYMIFVEGTAGLGNRLLSMVSAFTYALLTNRTFLISTGEHNGQLAELLCEPFPDSSWKLPRDFPQELFRNVSTVCYVEEEDYKKSTVRVELHHVLNRCEHRFLCSEARKRMASLPWMVYTSNQYSLPRFFTFPELWPQLSVLFPDPSYAFTHLSRYLLLPNNELWEKIFRIWSSYFSCADKFVGIQIRRHSPAVGDYSPVGMNRILSCLQNHEILPNTSTASSSSGSSSSEDVSKPGDRMLELMNSSPKSPAESDPGSRLIKRIGDDREQEPQQQRQRLVQPRYTEGVTSVLVASLQQKYSQVMEDLYTNHPSTDGRLVRVHMVTHEGSEWHSYDQSAKAFVEMWLLSLGDEVMTSSWSTFGYVAQGMGAMRPYLMNLRGQMKDDAGTEDDWCILRDDNNQTVSCVLGHSPDPCHHFPFYPKDDCGEKEPPPSPEHKEWLEKHYLPCQDEPRGRQLV